MGILVGILFINSILMAITIWLLNIKINSISNVLADLSIDIMVYESYKEHEKRRQLAKRTSDKVGNWTK
ncbi:hypothetical protein JCM17380_24500 [Desulfosporosinus burensis]